MNRRKSSRDHAPLPGARTCVLVLGMHRSGTSAVTRVVNLLGLPLGGPLLEPVAGNNEEGFWELASAVDINERILDCIGVPWDSPAPMPEHWLDAVPASLYARAAATIQGNFGDVSAFALKDPRVCRLWPFWLRVFDGCAVRTIALHVFRAPAEVAASMKARDGLSIERGAALWLRYNLEAEALPGTHMVLDYGALLAQPKDVVAALHAWLKGHDVASTRSNEDAILATLRPSLRHNRGGFAKQTAVTSIAQSLYTELALRSGGDALPHDATANRVRVAVIDRWLESAGSFEATQVPRLVDKLAVASREWVLAAQHALNLEAERIQNRDHIAQLSAREATLVAQGKAKAKSDAFTLQHVENLETLIAELRAQAAQQSHDEVLTRQHIGNLEAEAAGLRARLDEEVQSLLLTRQSVVNLEAMVADHVHQLADAKSNQVLLQTHVQSREILLAEREQTLQVERRAAIESQEKNDALADQQHVRIAELQSQLMAALASRDQVQGAFESLSRIKALTDQHVRNLDATITGRDHALEVMRASRSWRMTRPFRFAVRVWRTLLAWTGLQPVDIVPQPMNQLVVAEGGGFHATGGDPWFVLSSARQEVEWGWPAGWYAVTIRSNESDNVLTPKLYPDYGDGYDEGTAISLPLDLAAGRPAHFRLKQRARTLRLDPADRPGCIALDVFTVRKVPAIVVLTSVLRPLAARAWHTKNLNGKRVRKLFNAWRSGGSAAVVTSLLEGADFEQRNFKHWTHLYDDVTDDRLARYREAGNALAAHPLISIVVPAYNTPEPWLRACIDSVLAQTYTKWELCVVDDASTDPNVGRVVAEYVARDFRIKTQRMAKNGHIAAASNRALAFATGDFVALLDHDDELVPWALYWVAATISEHPDAVLIYSDEDKIDEAGERFDPYFKPDWNPLLLYAQNYVCHLAIYRRTAVEAVGGFREGFDGAQDWDLVLRVVERCKPDEIHHIPRILYHWRSVAGSTARHTDEKTYAGTAGHRAVVDALARAALKATVERLPEGYHRISYPLPMPAPLASIIIPTRNGLDLVRTCITSLRKTTYQPYEILLVDNQSDDAESIAYFQSLAATGEIRIIPYDQPFNFSAINNFAARAAKGEVLVFLNNDVEVIEGGWLKEMMTHAVRAETGVVGAKLLYPDETIQHAGVIVGFGGVAGHIGSREPRSFSGQMGRCKIAQNITAVTAACLAVRKSVFEAAGRFDEEFLRIAFNDIDLCLKVEALGYRNVWTPYAELFHHESASRGLENTPEKQARFQREIDHMQHRWGSTLLQDAAYNPNLDLERRTFTLAFPPRVGHLAHEPDVK